MAKGIAVVSGSNNVVFKALETGVIVAGSPNTDAVVDITGSLSVSGSTGSPTLYVDNDSVSIIGALDFTGDLQVTGNVYVSQDVSASQDLKAGRDLVIAHTASIAGDLDVEGATDLRGDLTVEVGVTTLADRLTVQSNGIIVTGSSEFKDNVTIKGDLTVLGDTTVTVDNVSNMEIKDAIIHVASGSDTAGKDLGFVFGSTNSKGFGVEDGIFILGSTTSTAQDGAIDVSNNGELRLGILSASSAVYVDGTLNVTDNVVLGEDLNDVITLNGVITASANALFQEDVTMGTDSDDLVKVVGQIRMPIFTVSGDNNVAGYPIIPDDYATNKAAYDGHMFYLTSSDNTNWTASGSWNQGNKWYFNERGDWHASFLFAE